MISIIVYTSGKDKNIFNTLQSVKDISYKNYELLILADGCSSDVLKQLKPYATRVVAFNRFRGPSVAKNEGAKRAKNEILLFIDSGTLLSDGVVEKIIDSKDEWVVGSCTMQVLEGDEEYSKIYNFINKRLLKKGYDNGLVFCKKTTFEVLGMFNVNLIEDENRDLIKRFKKMGDYFIIDIPISVALGSLAEKKGIDRYVYVFKKSFSKAKEKIVA